MSRKRVEIKKGDRYGRLTVLKEVNPYVSPKGNKTRRVLVQCSCGSDPFEVLLSSLRNGNTTSCGCYQREKAIENNKKKHKTNTYDLETYEYGIGWTSKGEPFYFDKEDYPKIKDYCWFIGKDGYVVTREADTNKLIQFHRLVMNASDGMDIDHINRVKSNNCKSNLREVTHSQNCMNRGIKSTNTSGVTGVCWHRQNNKWQAQIKINGKMVYLGTYANIEDAIQARKDAEEKYFGEYACKENVANE